MMRDFIRRGLLSCLVMAFAGQVVGQEGPDSVALKKQKTTWGWIEPIEGSPGLERLVINSWPENGKLLLPVPRRNILSAYAESNTRREALPVEFNTDATKISVQLATATSKKTPFHVILETAEATEQFADGRIVLSALDAQVQGNTAKLETHPGNHRIGFWSDSTNFVSWEYTATRPGKYEVELTYSLADGSGSEVEVSLGDSKLKARIAPTGSWYRYTTVRLGKVYLPTMSKYAVAVQGVKKTGAAVMNLKGITLRPTVEGNPITQAKNGEITCHARDVTIHGVKVQYEPKPEKNTVGYWIHVQDWVSWNFQVTQPGKYRVEILQGCGKGQGGSEVDFLIDGKVFPVVVEDTGHFQNFVPRQVGVVEFSTPDEHRLEVRPRKKPGIAVMDLRQVRFLPETAAP